MRLSGAILLPHWLFCFLLISTKAWELPWKSQRVKSFVSSRGFSGQKYGRENNSTIPTGDELAAQLGLQPFARAPNIVWKLVWRSHGRLLPLLHLFDRAKPRDADQSLKVVWNKAIAGLDRRSPASNDDYWTYDMLSRSSRWLLRVIPSRLFPRLHHANIEVRTVYLNQAIAAEISRLRNHTSAEVSSSTVKETKIRLIGLGSGYDTRYARMLTTGVVDEAWELDIEPVLEAKQKMLERLQKNRRKRNTNVQIPCLRSVDLNDVDSFRRLLQDIVQREEPGTTWHTIFVSEGVFIYLNAGVPMECLATCREVMPRSSFCFADLFRQVNKGNRSEAETEFQQLGWNLVDWLPKPGLARHMGVCHSS